MKEHVERRDGSQVNVDLEMIAATGGNRRGVVGLGGIGIIGDRRRISSRGTYPDPVNGVICVSQTGTG